MQFKIKELKAFLSSITKHKVENLQIESKNLKLIINTIKQENKTLINEKRIKPTIKQKRNKISKKDLSSNEKTVNNNSKNEANVYFTIISPMIGTFYRSPAPNEPAFIEINDLVKINQTVCIIEAMKLMNEIESEVDGHIVEILVQDGDIVDCGQALMRVKHK
uniref:acetyl-CoA carboxylase biotin carboxyl carrier protein n=1 Tax=Lithothamnion corallioides TaxID=1277934 RepID=UPI0023F16E19|nr:acetyl-CoA carboxylase biotin carboxyl carrier protein [Lithothamnion corallioides]WEA76942.1 acetyl-CoA carboxylase biotin carboxyl carrier protein [Lithothamnion corallioides]